MSNTNQINQSKQNRFKMLNNYILLLKGRQRFYVLGQNCKYDNSYGILFDEMSIWNVKKAIQSKRIIKIKMSVLLIRQSLKTIYLYFFFFFFFFTNNCLHILSGIISKNFIKENLYQ